MAVGMTGPTVLRRSRSGTRREGQALVEFVLIVPILLLLIFGLVDFARAWSAHHVIADAAREGTRMLVVRDQNVGVAQVTAAIQNRLSTAGLNPARATIEFDPPGGPGQTGTPTTVSIDYAFDLWVLGIFMNWATGDERINLVSTITMRTE
jgi:Flp pilus assembly protein TadG